MSKKNFSRFLNRTTENFIWLEEQQLSFHKDINYSEPVEFMKLAPPEEEIKQFLVDKALDISL
jgi:hypothetical protein